MFKLSLKGFEPLQDLEIESESGIFIVTGDDGMGVDYFTRILYTLGRILTNIRIESLYNLFNIWKTDPQKLEFSIAHNAFQYHVILAKKSHNYIADLEEITNGGQTLFTHSGTECNIRKKVLKEALEWKVLRHSEESFPLLEQMQVHDMADFMWTATPPLANQSAKEDLKYQLFRSGTSHIKEMDNYLHWLTDDYSGLTHHLDPATNWDSYTVYEHGSKKNVFLNSTKLLGILNLLWSLLNKAKVLWYPETVINNQKINNFYQVLKDFTVDKPIFVVTNNPEFKRGNTTLYFETDENGITCKCNPPVTIKKPVEPREGDKFWVNKNEVYNYENGKWERSNI